MPKLLKNNVLCFRKKGKKCPKKFIDLLNLEENKVGQNRYKYLILNDLQSLTAS